MTGATIDVYRKLVIALAKAVRKSEEIETIVVQAGISKPPVIDRQAESWVNWSAAVNSALDHPGALDKLVDFAADTQDEGEDGPLRRVYRECRSGSAEVAAPAVDQKETRGDAKHILRRLDEIRTQRRDLLGAKTVGAARQAADAIHDDAATLCGLLDNPRDRAVWPVVYTDSDDQQRVLDRVEKRLLDTIRWSAYVLRLAGGQLADADGMHPLNPEDGAGGRSDGPAARLIDAQIGLARETGRLLRLMEQEGTPGA